jgi:hypothetical protein
MVGYSDVERSRLVDAKCIADLFGKPATWFKRDRVRKTLYARGFPLPVVRGRWLRSAVDTWFEREGRRCQQTLGDRPTRSRPASSAR